MEDMQFEDTKTLQKCCSAPAHAIHKVCVAQLDMCPHCRQPWKQDAPAAATGAARWSDGGSRNAQAATTETLRMIDVHGSE
jgi:hypothetical protein